MSQPVSFTTPAGRLVAGSLYEPKTTDMSGRPLVVKSGPNIGQPRKDWFFALAIPKGAEAQHGPFGWMATPWGLLIRQVGEQFRPNATQLPAFAWKVKDGDSAVPNQAGRKPCDNEGWPGHWVVMFSSGYAPKVYTLVGQAAGTPALLDQPDAVKLGDFVQVAGNVAPNGDATKPGVFLNHNMLCLLGYGQRIVVGPDVASAGFGGVALPAGASLTPPAVFTPPAVPPQAPPLPAVAGAPVVPVVPALPGAAPSLPAPPAASVAPIVPNPAFLQVPSAPAAAVPPAPPARRMTAAANGASYEQLIAVGWTDATLVQHGLMAA